MQPTNTSRSDAPRLTPAQQRESTRAALAAALNGNSPSIEREQVAPLPAPPVLPESQANPAKLLLQANTVREFAHVYALLEPGRDASRHLRLKVWLDRIGDIPLAEITHDQIDAVLAELESSPSSRGTPRAGATINRYRMALAGLIKFARRRRRLPRGWVSPLTDTPLREETAGCGTVLTPDQEMRLMAAAALQQWPLMPLVIRIALTTALRRGNINNLQWRDVDFGAGVLRIAGGDTKNGQPHIAPMLPDVSDALKAIRPARAEPHHFVFHAPGNPNKARVFQTAWKRALHAAGITGFRFHDLRHSSCSRLGEAGVSALQIAEHSGHKSLRMVQRYVHLNVASRAEMVNKVFAK